MIASAMTLRDFSWVFVLILLAFATTEQTHCAPVQQSDSVPDIRQLLQKLADSRRTHAALRTEGKMTGTPRMLNRTFSSRRQTLSLRDSMKLQPVPRCRATALQRH